MIGCGGVVSDYQLRNQLECLGQILCHACLDRIDEKTKKEFGKILDKVLLAMCQFRLKDENNG